MIPRTQWGFWCALFIMGGVSVVSLWQIAAGWLCKMPIYLSEQDKNTCLEFWINRYQSLISGLLALLAAAVAAWAVWRQLGEMSRQSSAAARIAMVDIALSLEQELRAVRAGSNELRVINRLLEEYDDHSIWPSIYNRWREQCASTITGLETLFSSLEIAITRHPGDSLLNRSRVTAINAIRDLSAALSVLDLAFRKQTTGPYYDMGEEDLSRDDEREFRATAQDAFIRWGAHRARFEAALEVEVRQAWLRVRELEQFAMARAVK